MTTKPFVHINARDLAFVTIEYIDSRKSSQNLVTASDLATFLRLYPNAELFQNLLHCTYLKKSLPDTEIKGELKYYFL